MDAQTGEVLFNLLPTGFRTGYPWLTFSPDGKRLASNEGIWDAQAGQELLSFGNGRHSYSSQVFFSPHGHRLAIVPFNGNDVTIYDATPLPEKP